MIILNEAVKNEIAKVSEVSHYLWQREWAERMAETSRLI